VGPGGGDGATAAGAGAKPIVDAFTISDTSGVLALPRRTLSAKNAIAKSRGFEALLNSFDKMMQNAVREMAFDIAELSARKETLEARLAADELRRPDDPPPHCSGIAPVSI
jgi:hypothetical protein